MKLSVKSTIDNINHHLTLNNQPTIRNDAVWSCIINGLVDSINEGLEPEWKGKKIAFYTETRLIATGQGSWTIRKDFQVICKKEKGKFIELESPNGTIYEVEKDLVYLCDED